MALKDEWKDLQDAVAGVPNSGSDVSAEPINKIAHAVIDLEKIDTEMSNESENAVQNKVIKTYVDGKTSELQESLNSLSPKILELYNERVPALEANKADITYVDNAISSAIGEALEADY